jgi:hypothetical protein
VQWVRHVHHIPTPSPLTPGEVSVAEAADRLGISADAVYYWIKPGTCPPTAAPATGGPSPGTPRPKPPAGPESPAQDTSTGNPNQSLQEGQYEIAVTAIMDRCHQARVRNALEPEWEARFEPRSYGFRPGRSCADAIGSLYVTLNGPRAQRVWILDADLSAAFDRIDHAHILGQLGGSPARELVAEWLRAGVIEPGEGFAPTEQGTPQGGVITPPTQWATCPFVTIRVDVGVVVCGGGSVFADGVRFRAHAVPDGDLFGSDEDVFDEQAQDALAFGHVGGVGVVA